MCKVSLSIIVPFKNAEKYLDACINSILEQTYGDYELILIDDGSIDNSLKICERYSEIDQRIKILNNREKGLVNSRKTALMHAEGEYIGFVDADDWIDSDMYEVLMANAINMDADMVCSGLYRQFSDHKEYVGNTIEAGAYLENDIKNRIWTNMIYNGNYFQMGVRPNLVNKIIKRDMLEEIQMSVPTQITNGEDAAVVFPLLMKCKKLVLLDKAFYHYRQHNESMSKVIDDDEMLGRLKVLYKHLVSFVQDIDDNYKPCLQSQLDMYISNLLVQKCLYIYDDDKCQEIYGYNPSEKIKLTSFGQIDMTKKICIYGAGSFGKQIFSYLNQISNELMVVDKNSEFYRSQGLNVYDVDEIKEFRPDVILVALMDFGKAEEVRRNLLELGFENEVIRCLNIDYISNPGVLNNILSDY